ncbi:type II toxin-antitoxin system VapC family toxin [Pleurocapsales cyanobacterium LEGE 06147]|nr:type II toxin-antitoxin system VapC family toxin [Pleurocapsales cyanobacterium LEGE 06147]
MLLVIDSSVVAKWFFLETLSDRAIAVRQDWESSTVNLIAPDLMLVEVGNIIWKKQRLGLITEQEGIGTLTDLLALKIFTVEPQVILPRAYGLAKLFDRTVYDGLYLALAEESEASFVTADLRLCNAVRSSLRFIQYLGSY